MQLINTVLSSPFFEVAPHGRHATQDCRLARSIQPADERGPRLLPRDQRPAAGPFKGVAARSEALAPGREAVLAPQVELVHWVSVFVLCGVAGSLLATCASLLGGALLSSRAVCCCSSVGVPIWPARRAAAKPKWTPHLRHETRAVGGLRDWCAARETCLDATKPALLVCNRALGPENAIRRAASAAELDAWLVVEHSLVRAAVIRAE
jgi:hypothetical protein